MEKKRTREDDIPPNVKPELEKQVSVLHELQNHLRCAAHTKPGLIAYCWIKPSEIGLKGGHREMSHEEITLWAQYIVSTSCVW